MHVDKKKNHLTIYFFILKNMSRMVVTVPGDTRSSMTILARWIDSHGCKFQPGSKEKETHMSLVGGEYGKLFVPDDLHNSWLQMYTQELERGAHSLFFAERRTPVFRMHFDLDFTQPEMVTEAFLVDMASHINSVFRSFYPETAEDAEEWTTVLLCAPPKPVGAMVKSGCHMIWPWLMVDQGIALQLRLNVLAHIHKTMPPRPTGANTYEDVVDETVLKSNGLRMYGSDKAIKCKTCKSKRVACSVPGCMRGILVENRAYTLQTILTPAGTVDTERVDHWTRDLFACVRLTSTRSSCREPTPTSTSRGFVVPHDAISDDSVKRAHQNARTQKRLAAGGGPVDSEVIDLKSPIVQHLQNYVSMKLDINWVNVRVKQLFLQRDRGIYTCHVGGPGSLYCQNARRAHTSSCVYFEVTQAGIYQRCFSPKSPASASCKAFRGTPIQLNPWLKEAMFGGNNFSKLFMTVPTSETTTAQIIVDEDEFTSPDPWKHLQDPDYPGMTYAEVDNIPSSMEKEVRAQCFKNLPDPTHVHREIIKEGNPITIVQPGPKSAKKRKYML